MQKNSQHFIRSRRLHRALIQYSLDTGTISIPRPVEVTVVMRMLAETEEEREALIWRQFGAVSGR